MIIYLNTEQAARVKKSLMRGFRVRVGSLGYLEVKRVPDRRAFHNFTGKKRVISGYKKIIFCESK